MENVIPVSILEKIGNELLNQNNVHDQDTDSTTESKTNVSKRDKSRTHNLPKSLSFSVNETDQTPGTCTSGDTGSKLDRANQGKQMHLITTLMTDFVEIKGNVHDLNAAVWQDTNQNSH